MTTSNRNASPLNYLDGHLSEAARQARAMTATEDIQADERNTVLYSGNWQDSHPRRLLYDPALDARDKIAWMVIKAHTDPQSPRRFPSYDDFGAAGVGSKPTIAVSVAMLRITRWLCLYERVRDEKGRYRGNVYALHDEPVSVAEAMELDEGYVAFLESMCRHNHRRVRRTAQAVLATIQAELIAGSDITDDRGAKTRFETRLAGIRGHAGAFATGAYGELFREHQNNLSGDSGAEAQHRVNPVNPEGDAAQVKQFNLDENSQVKHVNSEDNSFYSESYSQVKQLYPSRARSSSGSSSYNNTTTSNQTARERGEPGDEPPLRYPTGLSGEQQRLARLCVEGLEPELAQQVFDELDGCLKDRSREPIRNPIRYLTGLARRAREGAFIPTYAANFQATGQREACSAQERGSTGSTRSQLSRARGAEDLVQMLKAAGRPVPPELAAQLPEDS
ncbi:STY4528 family pathogenicity island replication protein [Aquisalimonas lutea]|uniref:STY4528 family pathogenicity island replication protein n=1 Tax=Aquisalimonas lutea TaxID=1327750 RepID=UPI0025B52A0D|nr:STY4528 family pathogenicity island replication protein [Aquisalimonas lutea]MDN3519106.1 STY4528 family pathogenicity island replication protein [Aquisalimonas lutea]